MSPTAGASPAASGRERTAASTLWAKFACTFGLLSVQRPAQLAGIAEKPHLRDAPELLGQAPVPARAQAGLGGQADQPLVELVGLGPLLAQERLQQAVVLPVGDQSGGGELLRPAPQPSGPAPGDRARAAFSAAGRSGGRPPGPPPGRPGRFPAPPPRPGNGSRCSGTAPPAGRAAARGRTSRPGPAAHRRPRPPAPPASSRRTPPAAPHAAAAPGPSERRPAPPRRAAASRR